MQALLDLYFQLWKEAKQPWVVQEHKSEWDRGTAVWCHLANQYHVVLIWTEGAGRSKIAAGKAIA